MSSTSATDTVRTHSPPPKPLRLPGFHTVLNRVCANGSTYQDFEAGAVPPPSNSHGAQAPRAPDGVPYNMPPPSGTATHGTAYGNVQCRHHNASLELPVSNT